MKKLILAAVACFMTAGVVLAQNTTTVKGLVGDGTSMHYLQLCTQSDTLDIMIDDETDKSGANLVIGNKVTVTYRKSGNNLFATKISGSEDYVNALGSWTNVDPINKNKRIGVKLDINGDAKSINMKTLVYNRWENVAGNPGKLVLYGMSIGNGQTISIKTIVNLKKNSKGKWYMSDANNKVLYVKD